MVRKKKPKDDLPSRYAQIRKPMPPPQRAQEDERLKEREILERSEAEADLREKDSD